MKNKKKKLGTELFFIIALILLLFTSGVRSKQSSSRNYKCVARCECTHTTVRCDSLADISSFSSPHYNVQHLYFAGSQIPRLPSGIFSNVPYLTTLSVANTGLEEIIQGAFKKTKHLKILDLSYNKLTVLDSESLLSLTSLTVLKVNNNKITCIDPSLKYLKHLEILNLQSNLLSSLPNNIFNYMPALTGLRLDSNKFVCSCSILWLGKYLRKHPQLGVGTICHQPSKWSGKSIATLLPYQFRCSATDDLAENSCTTGTKCPELCKCSHGVVDCRNLGLTQVPADIPTDTVEMRLENNNITEIGAHAFQTAPQLKRIDLSRNKLKNVSQAAFSTNKKLTALILFDNNLVSIASNTLNGLYDLNMILLNKNNISCLPDKVFKHQNKLLLLSLYDNNLRSLPRNIFNKLTNLASIHLGANPWQCDCNLHWLQSFIKSKSVESSGAACSGPVWLREQTLETVPGDLFHCQAGAGEPPSCPTNLHTKDVGEDPGPVPAVSSLVAGPDSDYQRTSPCAEHDCHHGVCLATPGQDNGYLCQCDPGYQGKRCEYLVSVQLVSPAAHIRLEPLYTAAPINLTLHVKTDQQHGVLLYTGQRQHLAVELFKGRLRVSLDVGNKPASTIFSYELLSDDRPHSIQLLLLGRNLTMQVDGGLSRSVLNDGARDRLRAPRALYVGGVPPNVGETALGLWHLRNSTSLRGCILEMFINQKQVDFLQSGQREGGILPGCYQRYSGRTSSDQNSLIRDRPAARRANKHRRRRRKEVGAGGGAGGGGVGCEANKCRREGTRQCTGRGRRDYKCSCKRGYTGRYCERAPTCRKKKTRKYLEENGCRSRKLVNQKMCRGQCHGDAVCCKPTKVKKRKIGMICQDGTRYVRSVNIVKKCSCAKDRQCKNERRY